MNSKRVVPKDHGVLDGMIEFKLKPELKVVGHDRDGLVHHPTREPKDEGVVLLLPWFLCASCLLLKRERDTTKLRMAILPLFVKKNLYLLLMNQLICRLCFLVQRRPVQQGMCQSSPLSRPVQTKTPDLLYPYLSGMCVTVNILLGLSQKKKQDV